MENALWSIFKNSVDGHVTSAYAKMLLLCYIGPVYHEVEVGLDEESGEKIYEIVSTNKRWVTIQQGKLT